MAVVFCSFTLYSRKLYPSAVLCLSRVPATRQFLSGGTVSSWGIGPTVRHDRRHGGRETLGTLLVVQTRPAVSIIGAASRGTALTELHYVRTCPAAREIPDCEALSAEEGIDVFQRIAGTACGNEAFVSCFGTPQCAIFNCYWNFRASSVLTKFNRCAGATELASVV